MAASKLPTAYGDVHTAIVELLETARRAAARSVNALMTASHWEVGRRIVEFEQGGKERADYGEALIKRLSDDLTRQFVRGFGWPNLTQMRSFYLSWPADQILQTPSAKSSADQIHQAVSGEFTKIPRTLSANSLSLPNVQSPSGQLPEIAGGLGEGRQPRRGRGADAHLPRAARRLGA